MHEENERSSAREAIEARRKAEKKERGEKDDFWEIDMLVPKMRTAPRRAPGATDTAEISFGSPQNRTVPHTDEPPVEDMPLNLNPQDGEVVVRHVVPPYTWSDARNDPPVVQKPDIAYENEKGLIHQVKVYRWSSRYHYYRDFCEDAARYLDREPEEGTEFAEPVHFFSYVPQYSQLRKEQFQYYLWWRREFRRGNAVSVSESYLYLYAYEILNTAGFETAPEEGLTRLYQLFCTYGRDNARLSRMLSEWIVDYSLIFRLEVPESMRLSSDFQRTYEATLKEFYVSSPTGGTAGYAEMLLRFCTSYDYKKSHFYKGNNCTYFDRYLPGALSAVLTQYSSGDRLFSLTGMCDSHMVRNAFEQALCSHRIRYRIEVDYASFSRSHEMRFLVSDILKYTENRLRAFLGIKSRLTVYSLSVEVRRCIDRYCDEHFPRKSEVQRPQKPEEIPSYERLYDLPSTPLSLTHAAEIEQSSWETTRRLTEAFSDGEAEDAPAAEATPDDAQPPAEEIAPEISAEIPNTDGEAGEDGELTAVLGAFYPFAEAAYREDLSAQRRLAEELQMLPDLVADKINELAADAFGDILLEENDGGYAVIEDYRSLFH